MFNTRSQFGNRLSAIVGAVVMSATCMAIAVSPARAATPAPNAGIECHAGHAVTAGQRGVPASPRATG